MSLASAPATLSRPSPLLDGVRRAGAARVDITPPIGRGLAGHGFVAQVALGSLGRLWATALVLDDGQGHRVALLTIDLAAGSRWILARVATLVQPDTGLGLDTIFPLVAHAHRAPSSVLGNHTYDRIMGPLFVEQAEHHFDQETAEFLAERIATSLKTATLALEPAEVHLAECSADGLLWNRSASAYRGIRVDQDNDDELAGDGLWGWPDLAEEDADALARWLRETPMTAGLPETSAPTAALRALGERLWTPQGTRALLRELSELETSVSEEGFVGVETVEAATEDEEEDTDDLPTDDKWEARQTERLSRYIEKHGAGHTLDQVIVQLGSKALLLGAPPALRIILRSVHLDPAPSPTASSLRITDDRLPWIIARRPGGGSLIGAIGILNGTPTLVGSRIPVFCGDVPALVCLELSRTLQAPIGMGAGPLGDVNVVPLGADIEHLMDKRATAEAQMDRALAAASVLARRALPVLEAPAGPGSTLSSWSSLCWEADRDPTEFAPSAHLGASALAGSDLGRSSLAVLIQEGKRSKPRPDPVLQDPKKILPRLQNPPDRFLMHRLAFSREAGQPPVVLLGTPFEVSHALSARIRDSVRQVQGHAGARVIVASLCTDFAGYAGTPWEYISQSYEAAATLWGRRTGPWLRSQLVDACTAPPSPPATLDFSGAPMQKAPVHFTRRRVFRTFGTRNRVKLADLAWVLAQKAAARRAPGPAPSTIEVRVPVASSVRLTKRVPMGGPLVTVHGLDSSWGAISDLTVPVLQIMVLGRPRRSWYLRITLPDRLPAGEIEVRFRDPLTGTEHRLAC